MHSFSVTKCTHSCILTFFTLIHLTLFDFHQKFQGGEKQFLSHNTIFGTKYLMKYFFLKFIVLILTFSHIVYGYIFSGLKSHKKPSCSSLFLYFAQKQVIFTQNKRQSFKKGWKLDFSYEIQTFGTSHTTHNILIFQNINNSDYAI